jgi:hypothetical protein
MGKAGGDLSSIAYEKYQPGLSEKTLQGILVNSVNCT